MERAGWAREARGGAGATCGSASEGVKPIFLPLCFLRFGDCAVADAAADSTPTDVPSSGGLRTRPP